MKWPDPLLRGLLEEHELGMVLEGVLPIGTHGCSVQAHSQVPQPDHEHFAVVRNLAPAVAVPHMFEGEVQLTEVLHEVIFATRCAVR